MVKKAVISLSIIFIVAAVLWSMSRSQTILRFAFSIDIGSDSELCDPTPDGHMGFDAGDAYMTSTLSGTVCLTTGEGTDGTARDDEELLGFDPNPDAGSPPASMFSSPVGTCTRPGPPCYHNYFDMDGYDVINLDINRLIEDGYSPPFMKEDINTDYGDWGWLNCIHEVEHLAVSFDDDASRGWASNNPLRVPEESLSPLDSTYGCTARKDEIVGITLIPASTTPYKLDKVFGIANEEEVHADLTPNPDSDESHDDDVDALDMLYTDSECDIFLYSADHEGNDNSSGGSLLPGAIYQQGEVDPIIRPRVHLGLNKDVDIDAFEMVWLPTENGDLALGILFSVDDDDQRTGRKNESGGLDPAAIYASILDGSYYEIMSSLVDQELYGIAGNEITRIDAGTGAATIIGHIIKNSHRALACNSKKQLFALKDDQLIEINTDDPAQSKCYTLSESIWPLGMSFQTDIDLYAAHSEDLFRDPNILCHINIETLVVTRIGEISKEIKGLAFAPDGQLFGLDDYTSELCVIDLSTGSAISCNGIKIPFGYTEEFSLTFDGLGILYMANEYLMEVINYETTPEEVPIGALMPSTGYSIHGLASVFGRFDDIDAITVSNCDLFDEELDQPIIYEN